MSEKTMLTSMITEHLQSHYKYEISPELYLYLSHKEQEAQTAVNLIGSLLKQFASKELEELYIKRVGKTMLTWEDKKMAFCNEVRRYKRPVTLLPICHLKSLTFIQ